MKQKRKMYCEEDIKKEFTIIADEEYRDAVINHEFPDYMYGLVLPEILYTLIRKRYDLLAA